VLILGKSFKPTKTDFYSILNPKKLIIPFLAFLIPLLARCIPELLMGPYLVGFDTMAHYVPTTLLWLQGDVSLGSFFGTAPLLFTLTTTLTALSGSVFVALKVLPPILLGLLGLSIYTYAHHGISWSQRKSLFVAMLGALYFVALRISWDALREELAITCLFFTLTAVALMLAGKIQKRNYIFLSLAFIAVILANQVVAVLGMGIMLFSAIYLLLKNNRAIALRIIAFSLPAVSIFIAVFFLSPSIPEYRLIFGFPNTSDGWVAIFGYSSYPDMLASTAVFYIYCFALLLPLALLSVRSFKNFQMRIWVIIILLAAFVPIVSPSGLRIAMLLTYPLAFYAAEGLSRLKTIRWKRYRKHLFNASLVYLVAVTSVLGLGFMALSAATPFPYFSGAVNMHLNQIPSSMLQNTVAIYDCLDVENAVVWLNDNLNGNDALLAHRAFYGWALAGLDEKQVILYEYDNPADAAASNSTAGYSHLYLIWWTDGKGWYNLPSVPSVFSKVYQSGDIAVYIYNP
jgi:hypothetical protein